MTDAKTAVAHKPIWLDLSSGDAAGSRDFYAKLFGWKVEVNPDPQYGGYALATLGGKNVAGIGPKQMAEAPTAWNVYIGTPDAAESAPRKVGGHRALDDIRESVDELRYYRTAVFREKAAAPQGTA